MPLLLPTGKTNQDKNDVDNKLVVTIISILIDSILDFNCGLVINLGMY